MKPPYSSKSYMTALANGKPLIKLGNQYSILRRIPGSRHADLIGPYPFGALPEDTFNAAQTRPAKDVVSYTVVTDALAPESPEHNAMFDFVRHYKQHYVFNRNAPKPKFSKHHRYEINKAKQHCEVHQINLHDHLDEWCSMYDTLIERQHLSRFHQFSRRYFEQIAHMPFFVSLGAFADNQLVSAHIWLQHENHLYSHLAASSEAGYQTGAAYAVNAHAITQFDSCEMFDFGGIADGGSGLGLSRFKKGFTNDQKTNFLCGKILNDTVYKELCLRKDLPISSNYFPAYRKPIGA